MLRSRPDILHLMGRNATPVELLGWAGAEWPRSDQTSRCQAGGALWAPAGVSSSVHAAACALAGNARKRIMLRATANIRREINADLGFSESDRVEHARRMGWLCDQVSETGCFSLADFIRPTEATRAAFTRGRPPSLSGWIECPKVALKTPIECSNRRRSAI